ncbi:MAG TPA: M28 family peptidase [Planctomycetota bacterium]
MRTLFLLLPLLAAPTGSGDAARLERALATLSADEIRADLYFFADAEMGGRDTPSLEQRVAARFLRARLEQMGLAPGGRNGYFHEYARYQRRIDPARTHLTLRDPEGELRLAFGTDYFFPTSDDIVALDVAGELVWCGNGAKGDLSRPEVRGRIAVCLASGSARQRARYAREAGARGLVVLPDLAGTEDPAAEECRRTTEYARRGLLMAAPREDEIFPQAFLTLAAARRFAAAAGLASPAPPAGTPLRGQLSDVRVGSGPLALENVCALWPGSDPDLGREVVIVSAHYDHVGWQGGKLHPGADDNGSGSMGLLALAEALVEYGPLRRSVLLMWVSGEEKGLWGSAAWTQDPTLPEGHRAVCNLNIDMIGRNAPDYLLITPTRALAKEYNGLTRLAEELAPLEGFPRLGSADEYWERSDHMNFAKNLGIPVAFLFSDVHADYHKPTDTVEKIDCDKIRRVTRLVLRMLDRLQADELAL